MMNGVKKYDVTKEKQEQTDRNRQKETSGRIHRLGINVRYKAWSNDSRA